MEDVSQIPLWDGCLSPAWVSHGRFVPSLRAVGPRAQGCVVHRQHLHLQPCNYPVPVTPALTSSHEECGGSRGLVGVTLTKRRTRAAALAWLFLYPSCASGFAFSGFIKKEIYKTGKAAEVRRQQWAGGKWGCLGEAAGLGCGPWYPASASWEVQDVPVSSCQQDGEDAWQSPLHSRCHEFTLFLPLPATRRKKVTFFPLFRVCPGGGFAQGDAALAALRPHPGTSPCRHVPVPACPRPC